MNPSYDELQPTGIYKRGQELRNAIYGPIIPAHDDEHLKRYTRASGEFELAFGREPKAGDILCYEHVEKIHSTENYSRELGRMIEAWNRHLPQLTCPLEIRRWPFVPTPMAQNARPDAEVGGRFPNPAGRTLVIYCRHC